MAALLIAVLFGFQYGFAPGMQLDYETSIELSGFIPIFGGNEGTAVVNIDLRVLGLEPTKDGELSASGEIVGFRATFNEANVPLDAASVQNYFPKTKIRVSTTGELIESDAPDIKLPIRLPGLDVKRFPDITYVPIEFPKAGVQVGEKWKFSKLFGESEIHYECVLSSVKDDEARIDVVLKQEYGVLEDAALEVTIIRDEAERSVKTTMTGLGTVVFDTKRGIVKTVHVVNEAVSVVTELADRSMSERKLKSTFDIRLKSPRPALVLPKTLTMREQIMSGVSTAWSTVRFGAQMVWQSIVRGLSFGG